MPWLHKEAACAAALRYSWHVDMTYLTVPDGQLSTPAHSHLGQLSTIDHSYLDNGVPLPTYPQALRRAWNMGYRILLNLGKKLSRRRGPL